MDLGGRLNQATYIAHWKMENHHVMGKSTISTGPFL